MAQEREGQTEKPPALEAGLNYSKRRETEILAFLVAIIDLRRRLDEYEGVLSRAARGESEA